MANQGIIHLAATVGGRPICGTRRAIMSTTIDKASEWPRVCARCEAKRKAREAKHE